ncbi:MAG: hypothetical protein OXC07_06640 [Kistimonas sp.]|nr:hypothetical protein [Kistimonas sp.]
MIKRHCDQHPSLLAHRLDNDHNWRITDSVGNSVCKPAVPTSAGQWPVSPCPTRPCRPTSAVVRQGRRLATQDRDQPELHHKSHLREPIGM